MVPIVNRTCDGAELPEVGLGGGAGDLYQVHELELNDEAVLAELEKLCSQHIQDKAHLSQARDALVEAFQSKKKSLSLDQYGVQEDISLEDLIMKLSHGPTGPGRGSTRSDLPSTIVSLLIESSLLCSNGYQRFPYSRHSSYSELCGLVSAFQPKDIHPCTVDAATWNESLSMQQLFGHLCSGSDFVHDHHMRELLEETQGEGRANKRARYDQSQSTQSSDASEQPGEPAASLAEDLQYEELPVGPGLSPRTRTKRDEIRRAHRYLHEHAEPGLLEIEPLPSSWTPDPEQEQQGTNSPARTEVNTFASESHANATQELGSKFSGDGASSPRPHHFDLPSSIRPADAVQVPCIDLTEDESNDGEIKGPMASRQHEVRSKAHRTSAAGRERVMNRLRRNISAFLATHEDLHDVEDGLPHSSHPRQGEDKPDL